MADNKKLDPNSEETEKAKARTKARAKAKAKSKTNGGKGFGKTNSSKDSKVPYSEEKPSYSISHAFDVEAPRKNNLTTYAVRIFDLFLVKNMYGSLYQHDIYNLYIFICNQEISKIQGRLAKNFFMPILETYLAATNEYYYTEKRGNVNIIWGVAFSCQSLLDLVVELGTNKLQNVEATEKAVLLYNKVKAELNEVAPLDRIQKNPIYKRNEPSQFDNVPTESTDSMDELVSDQELSDKEFEFNRG